MVYFANDFLIKFIFLLHLSVCQVCSFSKLFVSPKCILPKCCCMSHVITHLWNFFHDWKTLLNQVEVHKLLHSQSITMGVI